MRSGLPSFLRYRQQRGRDVHCLRRPGVPTFWVGGAAAAKDGLRQSVLLGQIVLHPVLQQGGRLRRSVRTAVKCGGFLQQNVGNGCIGAVKRIRLCKTGQQGVRIRR